MIIFNEAHDDKGDGGDQGDVECGAADQEGQTKDQLVSNRLLTDSRWVCLF